MAFVLVGLAATRGYVGDGSERGKNRRAVQGLSEQRKTQGGSADATTAPAGTRGKPTAAASEEAVTAAYGKTARGTQARADDTQRENGVRSEDTRTRGERQHGSEAHALSTQHTERPTREWHGRTCTGGAEQREQNAVDGRACKRVDVRVHRSERGEAMRKNVTADVERACHRAKPKQTYRRVRLRGVLLESLRMGVEVAGRCEQSVEATRKGGGAAASKHGAHLVEMHSGEGGRQDARGDT